MSRRDAGRLRRALSDCASAWSEARLKTVGSPVQHRRMLRPALVLGGWIAAIGGVAALFAVILARTGAAPVIIADNAYIFLAVDRWFDGLGLTAPPPRIPAEPWQWRCDWAFLTQWPMGYPLLLGAARLLLGASTAEAAVALSALCGGVAVVSWFVLVRRCLPGRVRAALIAALAGASAVHLSDLAVPASDTVLLALVPLVLLCGWPTLGWPAQQDGEPSAAGCPRRLQPAPGSAAHVRWGRLALFGLFAGALVWVRYAAIFVPLGLGLFLAIEWVGRRMRFGRVAVFAAFSAAPVVGLALVNRIAGADLSVGQRYPVGDRASLELDADLLLTAWDRFTAQTFYAHRPEAAWFFAVALPVAGLGLPLAFRRTRGSMVELLSSPPVRLCAVLTATCLLMLIGLSALFRSRFDYVALDRYYAPIKPLYFLFFLGGVATLRPTALRAAACVPLLLACSWVVNQDWGRAYRRLAARADGVTPYGRRAMYFVPHSAELYGWLESQRSDGLLVLSNFHDDLTLETGIPACPTPCDPGEMEDWLARVRQARGVSDVRVLFVLDPDNHGRRYFLPPPADLVGRFDLVRADDVPPEIAPYVYTPRGHRRVARVSEGES